MPLILAAALAGTPQHQHHSRAAPAPSSLAASTQALTAARSALENSLLDYPDARFRSVTYVSDHEYLTGFCGEMNTKNAMGGYTGWTAFFLRTSDDALSTLYDKLTIAGTPTKMDAALDSGGDTNPDSSRRIIGRVCSPESHKLDQHDYSADLSFRSR